MQIQKSHSIKGILQSNRLNALYRATQQISRTQMAVRHALPKDLSVHCWLGHIEGKEISVYTHCAVWARQLRSHLPKLQKFFDKNQHIRVRVTPHLYRYKRSITQLAQPHVSVAPLIQCTAQYITHPALKKALERLAHSMCMHHAAVPQHTEWHSHVTGPLSVIR